MSGTITFISEAMVNGGPSYRQPKAPQTNDLRRFGLHLSQIPDDWAEPPEGQGLLICVTRIA